LVGLAIDRVGVASTLVGQAAREVEAQAMAVGANERR
jgi:hypothetical protein